MKKTIWVAAGVAGMLLGNPAVNTQAETRESIQTTSDHSFVIDARPSFIYLPDQGFAVSVDSPYDIISGDDHYFLNQKGSWYRSSSYRGPWELTKEKHLPSNVRKHRLEDIRKYRDAEYNKIINQRTPEQQRSNDNNRPAQEQQRSNNNNWPAQEQQKSNNNNWPAQEQQRTDDNRSR
uniref:Uncharacterized protein n=1 Tax=Chlorobium chlorochromatii (strain CaD3) TaxID=340177 RepID=Q3ARS8_CHLCH